MEGRYIDINCDVGEGIGNEAELFPLISSCNIACGGHAGNRDTMRGVVQLAKHYKVKVGAHPSYPDTKNFGRKSMKISPALLQESIQMQINSLLLVLEEEGVSMHHIKPHGALYNDAAQDEMLAKIVLNAILPYKEHCSLYAPYDSIIAKKAVAAGYLVSYEAFGDRNYNADLSLVSRSRKNALIQEPAAVLKHLLSIITRRQVRTIDDQEITLLADTFCIHGDTPSALQILTYLSRELPKHNIYIKQ